MITLSTMHALLHAIHNFLAPLQYHPVCHFHRNHSINPLPGRKWVTVAHIRCTIKAPAWWYRSP